MYKRTNDVCPAVQILQDFIDSYCTTFDNRLRGDIEKRENVSNKTINYNGNERKSRSLFPKKLK